MALQEAWLRVLEWDEEFPDDLKLTTHQWTKRLPEAPQFKIPRCYQHYEKAVEDVSLHTFVDASRLRSLCRSKLRQTREWTDLSCPGISQSKSNTD